MTANKILNIGKAGVKVSWALAVLIVTVVFIIVEGFFKIFATVAALDDGKDINTDLEGVGEEHWELNNPNAGSIERAEAYSKGLF